MAKTLKDHLYVLILCGGGGTRLWPRSRTKTPKQFLPRFYNEESIFTQTIERSQWLTSNEKIFVITNKDYIDEVVDQGKVISPRNIIVEPQKKNTAMASGVGAAYIKKIDPEAVIINFSSDHVIGDKEIFIDEILLAAEEAYKQESLLTIGIKPTSPHTGYVYIQRGEKLSSDKEIFKVVSFKEKPDIKTAESFVSEGNYFWNANLYVWGVKAVWEAFEKFSPSHFKLMNNIFNSLGTSEEGKTLIDSYEKAEEVAVDYAISEKADNLLLVPGTFLWNDVGDWKVIYDLKEKGSDGNVVETFGPGGKHLGVDTKDCLVTIEDRLVATVGVSNLVIVQTKDAILVCNKDKAQDVKKIVNLLKEKGEKDLL